MNLIEYIQENAIRCASYEAEADVIFFGVKKGLEANADTLKALMAQHKGEFCELNPLDGKEHSYTDVGGWIGDQGAALTLMGLGAALGVWKLLTPKTLLGDLVTPKESLELAGMGMVLIQVTTKA